MSKKGDKDAAGRNMAMEVKGIETYLSREGFDTKAKKAEEHHVAGAAAMRPDLVRVANSTTHESNLGRVGGRRGSATVVTTKAARRQLAEMRARRPELFQTNLVAASPLPPPSEDA